ncbi:MAG: hypothetical protein QF921_04950 [Pseudomonadales bacterium]|nr:hypothetical protein [Pseudomonadales bacterium]MDP6471858.1 hypothetical protein [Pseudomonadales bacterium]MDP6826872.1 hypothetical protein [Pseudomonadales bacterium]MDP6970850.1 hypothetical protein [Pseudomonadales bacterium]
MIKSFVTLCVVFTVALAHAYETDPYTNRHIPIADSTDRMDERVNTTLAEIAENWKRGEDERAFVRAVYNRLGGRHWVDKFERWVIDSLDIEKLENSRKKSVYNGVPLYANRVAGIFGFGPTVKVAGVFVGTDKFGHFFSQGRKFYDRYVRTGDEAEAARRSAYTESAIFGQLTTGIYSNADVVANFEGYRFYRSLFNDNPNFQKPPIFVWRGGKPEQRRAFTWNDHVNDFWDEAINANHSDRILRPHLLRQVLKYCRQYREFPGLYTSDQFEVLWARYLHIGLKDTRELSAATYLGNHCPP